MDYRNINDVAQRLHLLLGPELTQIVDAVVNNDKEYSTELPSTLDIDNAIDDIAEKVAITSNTYGRIARLNGIAKAEYKLVKGAYDRKYKEARVGPNEHAREANAMGACKEEHQALTALESIIELADALEARARIASESARKILGAMEKMFMASARERQGAYRSEDYSTY